MNDIGLLKMIARGDLVVWLDEEQMSMESTQIGMDIHAIHTCIDHLGKRNLGDFLVEDEKQVIDASAKLLEIAVRINEHIKQRRG